MKPTHPSRYGQQSDNLALFPRTEEWKPQHKADQVDLYNYKNHEYKYKIIQIKHYCHCKLQLIVLIKLLRKHQMNIAALLGFARHED